MTKRIGKVIELEQNEINSRIMKDDEVMLIEQTISGVNFIDIELLNGDGYE